MKTKLLVILIGLAFLSACGVSKVGNSTLIDGSAWELVYIGKSTVMEGVSINLKFADGQINGSAGCNSYFGAYETQGNTISIGQIGMTEMFCVEPEGLMDMEMMFVEWLMDAQRFEVSADQLMIFRSNGEALTFIPLG